MSLLQRGRALRLFISCKADVLALDKGLKSPVDLRVFTDHELESGERRRGMVHLDPYSPDVLHFPDGAIELALSDGSTAVIERRTDDSFGYELTIYSEGELASFFDKMEVLPLAMTESAVA